MWLRQIIQRFRKSGREKQRESETTASDIKAHFDTLLRRRKTLFRTYFKTQFLHPGCLAWGCTEDVDYYLITHLTRWKMRRSSVLRCVLLSWSITEYTPRITSRLSGWPEKKTSTRHQSKKHFILWNCLSWSGLWTHRKQKGVTEEANYALTHSPEELLIKFKGHERAGQVTKPLFKNAGNNMDVVVIQVYAVHIWNRKTHSDKVTYRPSLSEHEMNHNELHKGTDVTWGFPCSSISWSWSNSVSPVSSPWRSSLILLVEPDFL